MADRISALPDALISHILSFLPTSVAITTTVLSKRWNSLWCLCPTLSFDDSHYLPDAHDRNYSRFVQSVHIAILSRHCHQTIQSFRLKCRSLLCDSTNVSVWINVVVQRGVQHLDLSFVKMFTLPSSVLTCKTLVVLKLNRFIIKNFSSVDFPMLKIMHLRDLTFLEHRHFVELLSAAPNLEDLEAVDLIFFCRAVQPRFKTLPKLDRAMIAKIDVSLVVLSNAKFLRVDWMDDKGTRIDPKTGVSVFHNMIHVEFGYMKNNEDWVEVLEMLNFCPKLQVLVIDKMYLESLPQHGVEVADWSYRESVPVGISSLRSCRLNSYKGLKGELRFAEYVMGNAEHLQSMIISSSIYANPEKRLDMIKELCKCTRSSASCKLIFK